MADPIQTARIVEAMAKVICAAFEDSTPEFAEQVWAQQDHPDEEVRAFRRRDVAEYTAIAQAALSTAYPMIREEMAKIAEAWGGPPCTGQSWVTISKKGIATAIRTTELPLAEKERE